MSTRPRNDDAGSDGLGGTIQAAPIGPLDARDRPDYDGEDEPIGFPVTEAPPQAPPPEEEPPLHPARPRGVARDVADAWAGLGDVAEDLREKKKWSHPSQLAEGYAELERDRGRALSRAQELEQQLAQSNQYLEQLVGALENQSRPQQQQGDDTPVDFSSLVEDFDGDVGAALNVAMHHYAPSLVQAMIRQELAAYDQQRVQPIDQRIDPIAQRGAQQALRSEADRLHAQYGPLFSEVADEAVEILQSDPSLIHRPDGKGMEIAFALAHARYAATQARQASVAQTRGGAAADAQTLDGGARGPVPVEVDVAQAIRDSIRNAGPRFNDGLGY